MFLVCATLSLVIGLYFLRSNIILSILISIAYLSFLFIRLSKKRFLLCFGLFILGVGVPVLYSLTETSQPITSGIVLEARDNYVIVGSKFHKYYVSSSENNYELGDHLVFDGKVEKLKFANYESRFDFTKYLENKGVVGELKVKNIDSKYSSPIKIHAFKKKFLSNFDENTATLISAFLFNDKDYSSDLIKKADNCGLIYLFSLSGTYLNLLFGAMSYLFFLKFKKKTSKLLPFIVLLPYAFFSFYKIGTLRVYSFYFLKYLNEFRFKKHKFTHIELVSILALFFVIIDYHLVYQEAFYIGFLLSVLSPFIHNSIKCFSKKKQKYIFPIILRTSLIPFQIQTGNISFLFFIFQLIIFPINVLFLILAMLSTVIPFYGVVNSVGSAITWILEKMDLINFQIPCGDWGGALGIVFVSVLFLIINFLERVRMKHAKIAICFLITLLSLSIVPLQEPITNAVYFVNVGQGDSIIIKNRANTVMIDTGGQKSFDIAEESLIPFMNKKKITHIDVLITTHNDFDHNGGAASLMANFDVRKYVTKETDFPLKIGDIYLENLNTFSFEEDNDKSLVLYMNFMNKKFLFMGDASTEVEKEIIDAYDNIECDILKVGHHGSKTSTCEEFINAIKPKEAIISVGAKNYYGHPNDSVISILNKYNVKIRRTDEEGTISYLSLFA